jgi:acetyl esterase/lipase
MSIMLIFDYWVRTLGAGKTRGIRPGPAGLIPYRPCSIRNSPEGKLMLRIVLFAAAFFLAGTIVRSQMNPQRTILLWPNGAPGALGTDDEDKPSLTIYPVTAQNKTSTAVIVIPGGSYTHLASDHEGKRIAEWLNRLGITAFVLKYRLGPKYHHPIELGDAQRAIRYVRLHASEYGYDARRIGVWGFSAGGHLASSTGTHFDAGSAAAKDAVEQQSSRPNFMILAYPVITFTEPYLHRGSRDSLLGANPDQALINLLSNEKQVTKDTPPTFLFHTTEDDVVPVENSLYFYEALQKAGVPSELHIYLKGHHGVGLAQNDPILKTWPDRVADWLKAQGFR